MKRSGIEIPALNAAGKGRDDFLDTMRKAGD
jgi:hypothetical protein